MNPILHIAGPMGPDQIQRCARCFKPLKDHRRKSNLRGDDLVQRVALSLGGAYPEGAEVEQGDYEGGGRYQAMSLIRNEHARPCRVTEIGSIVDELTYRSYRENRRLSPHVTPERWQAVYLNALNLETRYQEEIAGSVLMAEAFGAEVLS